MCITNNANRPSSSIVLRGTADQLSPAACSAASSLPADAEVLPVPAGLTADIDHIRTTPVGDDRPSPAIYLSWPPHHHRAHAVVPSVFLPLVCLPALYTRAPLPSCTSQRRILVRHFPPVPPSAVTVRLSLIFFNITNATATSLLINLINLTPPSQNLCPVYWPCVDICEIK